MFEQNLENLKRLVLQLDPDAVLAQFSGFEIHLEGPEADWHARRISPVCHISPKIGASLARVVSGTAWMRYAQDRNKTALND